MKTVSAREANQAFSKLLAEAEAGQEIIITKHGRPVAVLRPHRPRLEGAAREVAIREVIELMQNAPKLGTARPFTRDEIYEERLGKWLGSTPTS